LIPLMKPVGTAGVPRATIPSMPACFFTSRAASAISSIVVGTLILWVPHDREGQGRHLHVIPPKVNGDEGMKS
jgi:hypothetical protein